MTPEAATELETARIHCAKEVTRTPRPDVRVFGASAT